MNARDTELAYCRGSLPLAHAALVCKDMSACLYVSYRPNVTNMLVHVLAVVSMAGYNAEMQWVKLCREGYQLTLKKMCFCSGSVVLWKQ